MTPEMDYFTGGRVRELLVIEPRLRRTVLVCPGKECTSAAMLDASICAWLG